MQVRDVMNKSVRTVRPDTKVMEVASLMCLYRYHGLPVTEEDGTLVGFIAEKDLLHCLFPTFERLREEGLGNVDLDMEMGRYAEVLGLSVSDLMTRNPIYVMEDDLAAEAVKAVSNRHIDDLVVLNAEMTPVGIVDLQDLARLKLV